MVTQKRRTPTQRQWIEGNKAQGCDAEVFWHAPLEECLAEIRRVYAIRRKGEMGRRYYYALLTAGLLKTWAHVYEPDGAKAFPTSITQAQAWVSGIITAGRRNGSLSWSVISDSSRSSWAGHYLDLTSDIEMIGQSYFSLDPWLGQTKRVEVWVEKEDAFDMVLDICQPYYVPVNSVKGFASADPIHRAAARYGTGKNVVLYYIGDFDPSGLEIEKSLYQELWNEGCRAFQPTRLAVTAEQARTLDSVAAQELKQGDSRYKKFIAKYGADVKGFEMDAYPSDQLERDLKAAIHRHIDPEPWHEALRLQKTVREWVTDQARGLLGGGAEDWSRAIRHDWVLIDPQSEEPFPPDVLEQYLGPSDDDDVEDNEDDDGL